MSLIDEIESMSQSHLNILDCFWDWSSDCSSFGSHWHYGSNKFTIRILDYFETNTMQFFPAIRFIPSVYQIKSR